MSSIAPAFNKFSSSFCTITPVNLPNFPNLHANH